MALCVSHGAGPLPALPPAALREAAAAGGAMAAMAEGNAALGDDLAALAGRVPKPRAVLVVSAHDTAAGAEAVVGANEAPALRYDYGGFPPEAYELQYAPRGAVAAAEATAEALRAAGVPARLDKRSQLDHGAFVPLMRMYPEADVPVATLSLLASGSAQAHVAMGAALRPLVAEGSLLVLGSGMASYHNMGAFMGAGGGEHAAHAAAFDAFLAQACALPRHDRCPALSLWEAHPSARFAHPEPSHFLPLLVAAAAGAPSGGVSFAHAPLLGLPCRSSAFLCEPPPAARSPPWMEGGPLT